LVKVFAPIFYPKGRNGASALFGCMARLPTAVIETPTFQK
jgi:hypothetical protein